MLYKLVGNSNSQQPCLFFYGEGGVSFFLPPTIMKNTKTCSNCKHWITIHNKEVDGVQIGECDNLVVIRPNYGDPSRKTMVPNGVLTEDSGVGTNSLYTGPEFGCIHFDRNCGPIGTYYSSVIDSQDWNTIIIKNVTGDEVMWLHSRDPATNGLMSKGDLLSCYREITSEEFETLRESWKNLK